jgi:hypothetical protein
VRRFTLSVLLALSAIALVGCAQVFPRSAAWKEEVNAYFVKWNAIDDRELTQAQAAIDILATDDLPTTGQIAKLKKAVEAYPQIIKDAEAVVPPKDLKPYHALWLRYLVAERDTVSAMADVLIDLDLVKLKKADKLGAAADAAEADMQAELERFNEEYGTDYP